MTRVSMDGSGTWALSENPGRMPARSNKRAAPGPPFCNRKIEKKRQSAFRELEARAGFLVAVFLALDNARIALDRKSVV
jgi:hypothetical protein